MRLGPARFVDWPINHLPRNRYKFANAFQDRLPVFLLLFTNSASFLESLLVHTLPCGVHTTLM